VITRSHQAKANRKREDLAKGAGSSISFLFVFGETHNFASLLLLRGLHGVAGLTAACLPINKPKSSKTPTPTPENPAKDSEREIQRIQFSWCFCFAFVACLAFIVLLHSPGKEGT